jgi:hypothetical protein
MITTTKGWAAFVSTPRGYDVFYDLAQRGQSEIDWEFFQAPSTANPLFTQDELEDARKDMSEDEFAQEIMAEFREIHRGSAYKTFGRHNIVKANPFTGSGEWSPYLPIIVGLDFNNNPMAWCLGQKRAEDFYFGEEIYVNNTHTQEVAQVLVERTKHHAPGLILVGDASGKARRTASVGETDYTLIEQALKKAGIKYQNLTPDSNPGVRDRINTLNSKFKNAEGITSLWINEKCKHAVKDFQRVAWKDNAGTIIDKTSDPSLTHMSDSIGYPVYALAKKWSSSNVKMRVITR